MNGHQNRMMGKQAYQSNCQCSCQCYDFFTIIFLFLNLILSLYNYSSTTVHCCGNACISHGFHSITHWGCALTKCLAFAYSLPSVLWLSASHPYVYKPIFTVIIFLEYSYSYHQFYYLFFALKVSQTSGLYLSSSERLKQISWSNNCEAYYKL